jgi:hypothetical protein
MKNWFFQNSGTKVLCMAVPLSFDDQLVYAGLFKRVVWKA